ncbi:MAG TPA: MFS transporter [Polyangiaceae bacterium]|nr:MFS transporter [Polyangiaceae bacterium]
MTLEGARQSASAAQRTDDSRRSAGKLGVLIALYFVQGMPFGFQATALPTYLRKQGVSVAAIGFLGVLSMPWLFKALWAPLVDRYGSLRFGRRKSWIAPLQALQALVCIAAGCVSVPNALPFLLALVFAMNLLAATQDIAVDGWAVDTLQHVELGLANAVQVAGFKLGMLTGGGLLVWASRYIGWSGLFFSMAVINLLILGVALAAREPPPAAPAGVNGAGKRELGLVLRDLIEALRVPNTAWLFVFIATYKFGESLSDLLYKPFLVDAGIAPERIGLWVGTWGMLASLVGTVSGGLLASGISLLRAVGIAALLRVFPLLARVWLASSPISEARFIGVTLSEEFFGGALTTAVFAFMMSRVDRKVSASHYTLLASVEVAGKLPGGPIGGLLVGSAHWSYAQSFLLGAVLSVLFLLLLWPLRSASLASEVRPS